jgi:hypothetical protein
MGYLTRLQLGERGHPNKIGVWGLRPQPPEASSLMKLRQFRYPREGNPRAVGARRAG